jgi:hypothetical protein
MGTQGVPTGATITLRPNTLAVGNYVITWVDFKSINPTQPWAPEGRGRTLLASAIGPPPY